MSEHPIQQPIREIDVYTDADGDLLCFRVGRGDITRIEACTKSGMHADIPYVRVWADDICHAEFCQHNIVGVYFDPPAPPARSVEPNVCADCGQDICDCIPF